MRIKVSEMDQKETVHYNGPGADKAHSRFGPLDVPTSLLDSFQHA